MHRKQKIMNHQIDQLKEEISTKETALVKEHLDHQRVEKDKEALKTELTRMKQSAAESRAHLEALEMEERKLLKIISEADAERLRQKKELDQVMMMMMMMMMMNNNSLRVRLCLYHTGILLTQRNKQAALCRPTHRNPPN